VERVGAWCTSQWGDDWGIGFSMGTLDTGEALVRLVRLPMWTSPLAIWSPVIASISITLLTLVLLAGRTGPRPRPGAVDHSADFSARLTPSQLLRWAMAAVALIGLNVAAAVYGPFPEPGCEQPCPKIFDDPTMAPDMPGDRLIRDQNGRLVKRPADGGAERPATAADYPPPLHEYDARTRVLDTIVYSSDGSVAAYAGNPGLFERLISRPCIIKPPTRSFLEVWWPTIGSASASLLVIGVLWCQARWRRPEPRSKSDARVDLATSRRESDPEDP
jgi:hypothetical protein